MDDSRIRELTEEVLSKLALPAEPVAAGLESRVAALEAAVRSLQAGRGEVPSAVTQALVPSVTRARAGVHPALQVVAVAAGGERCVLEPDKPCVQSGQCRAFGH